MRWRSRPDFSLHHRWSGRRAGRSWRRAYKPYPCGFVIHPVLDCVLDWRRDHPARPKSSRVVVRGNPLLSVRADRPNISTGREAQVSVQHAVAAALLTGQAGLDQFTDACVRDPQVQALREQGRGRARRAFPDRRGGGRDHHGRRQGASNWRRRPRAAATPIR